MTDTSGEEEEEDEEETTSLIPQPRGPRCKVPWAIEVVGVLYSFAAVALSPIITQYVYLRIAHEVMDSNSTLEVDTCNDTRDDHSIRLEADAQTAASHWGMWMSLCNGVTSVVSTVFLGAYTDYFGRRLALLLPCVGDVIQNTLMALVIHFRLNLWWLVVARAIAGLGGGFDAMYMALFSCVADVTSHRDRSSRITIIEVIGQISMALSSLWTGYYIQWTGFFVPMATNIGILLVTFVVAFTSVPNIGTRDGVGHRNILMYYKETLRVVVNPGQDGRRTHLLLILAGFCLLTVPVYGRSTSDTLYLLNHPFCWHSSQIGIFTALRTLSGNLGSFVVVYVLGKRFGVSDLTLAVCGGVSGVLWYLAMYLSRVTWQVYLVAVPALLAYLPFPMLRALASKAVSPQEQGAMFANMAVADAVFASVGGVLLTSVYGATNAHFPGAVFLVEVAFALLLLFSLGCVAVHGKYRYNPRQLLSHAEDVTAQ